MVTGDTATVVITVGVGTTNLAFGKHATQSSTYRYSDPVAGYAVTSISDGNRCNSSPRSGTNMISADGDEWI
jgi:hypothetical protein